MSTLFFKSVFEESCKSTSISLVLFVYMNLEEFKKLLTDRNLKINEVETLHDLINLHADKIIDDWIKNQQ